MSIDATVTFTGEHDVDVKFTYFSSLQDRLVPILPSIAELITKNYSLITHILSYFINEYWHILKIPLLKLFFCLSKKVFSLKYGKLYLTYSRKK